MLERFLAYIQQKNLIKNNASVLLAVSGGIDSMVMAELFKLTSLSHGIAHINHHLRGFESDGDAAFVQEHCRMHGIPFYLYDLNPEMLKKGNLQQEARQLRYDWLNKTAEGFKYKYIATAHHGDDAVETFMINLLRGSGLSGLTGIPQERENIIRPLLFADRKDIDDFAIKYNINYRDDCSNDNDKYLRNRIRHHILPALYMADERAKSGFRSSIEHIRQSKNLLDFLVSEYSQKFITSSFEEQSIDLSVFPEGEVGEQWLFQVIRKYEFNISQAKDILDQKYKSGNYYYTKNYESILDRGHLIIRKKIDMKPTKLKVSIHLPFIFDWYNYKIIISISPLSQHLNLIDTKDTLYINADNLSGQLELRTYQQGDSFKPTGMHGKSQKLKDFLTNNKISVFEKEKIVVLTHDGEIIAIPGYRKSELVKVKHDTKQVLKVNYFKI